MGVHGTGHFLLNSVPLELKHLVAVIWKLHSTSNAPAPEKPAIVIDANAVGFNF